MLILQWIGGTCYLLNKVFFSIAERRRYAYDRDGHRRWRIAAWLIYLAGLLPWLIIFTDWHAWIAFAVETSGAPAMVLGIVMAWHNDTREPPQWLDRFVKLSVCIGLACSIYDVGLMTSLQQWLEVGLAAGFLVGTALLAKDNLTGYLWFVLMHVSTGWLMHELGYFWLFMQQVASLLFIADAYVMARRFQARQLATT